MHRPMLWDDGRFVSPATVTHRVPHPHTHFISQSQLRCDRHSSRTTPTHPLHLPITATLYPQPSLIAYHTHTPTSSPNHSYVVSATPTSGDDDNNDNDNDAEDALFVKAADGTLRLLRDGERTKKGKDGKMRVIEADGVGGPMVLRARVPHDRSGSPDKRYFAAGSLMPQPTGGITVRAPSVPICASVLLALSREMSRVSCLSAHREVQCEPCGHVALSAPRSLAHFDSLLSTCRATHHAMHTHTHARTYARAACGCGGPKEHSVLVVRRQCEPARV
jgi:hypothetical protein